jgi:hypothetical protein
MRVWCLTPLSTNISVISWWWVLLVEETVVPGENHRLAASHWQTLSHNVVWNTPTITDSIFRITKIAVYIVLFSIVFVGTILSWGSLHMLTNELYVDNWFYGLTYICNKELLYKYSKYLSSLNASHGTDRYIFILRMRVWCLTPHSQHQWW